MKKTSLFLLAMAVAATLSAPAMAQDSAPTAASSGAGVNPFLGTPINFENTKQQLELAKLQTQLLDEQVKQRAAEIDLKQLPKKRDVELRKLMYGAGGASADIPAIQLDGGAPKTAKASSKKKAAPKAEAAAPAVPMAPRVEVLGVTDAGGGKSAMISVNGNIASVTTGDMTPAGRVQLSGDKVIVGGKSYALHGATLSRLTVPSAAAGAGPAADANVQPGAGAVGGVAAMLRNAGPATSRGPLPPGLAPIVR